MSPDELLQPWLRALPELDLFDAHTHTGWNDPDGYSARAGAVAEAKRCLAAGARGLKLHPRAEGFTLDHPEVERLVALADERRLPIMVHAGRGIPALGRHALELTERHRGARLILAHAGISDVGWLWRHADERPNLFYDSSWWATADLLALFTLVAPGRILMASDAPYGTPGTGLLLALRPAIQAGLNGEQLACVAGRQTERLVAGEEPLEPGAAPALAASDGSRPPAEQPVDLLLDRVQVALSIAIGRAFGGASPDEYVSLARLACEVGDDAPQAPVCRSVLALLDRWEAARKIHLLTIAACVARTPAAPLPDVGELEESAGERSA